MSEHVGEAPPEHAHEWWRPLWRLVPRPIHRWLTKRFADIEKREAWGYAVWGTVALVIAIPEITAAASTGVPFPTISGTVGHLEARWTWVAVIVVGLLAASGFQAVRYVWSRKEPPQPLADDSKLVRSPGGRLVLARPGDDADTDEVPLLLLGGAVAVIVSGSVLVAQLSTNKFIVGYVLYGLIAAFGVVVPSILAYRFKKDVPFPTIFKTIEYLAGRLHVVTLLIVAGIAILGIHLGLYPWPDIIRDLSQLHQHGPAPTAP